MNYLREPMRVVKVRLGGFQERERCECQACRVYGVDEPPVLVPDGYGPDDTGLEVPYGRWLHGRELAQHLVARRQFLARLKEMIRRYAEPADQECIGGY